MTDREARLEKALRELLAEDLKHDGGIAGADEFTMTAAERGAVAALAEQPGETGLPKEGTVARQTDFCANFACEHQRSMHKDGRCNGRPRPCPCEAFVEPISEQPAAQPPPEPDAATTEGREQRTDAYADADAEIAAELLKEGGGSAHRKCASMIRRLIAYLETWWPTDMDKADAISVTLTNARALLLTLAPPPSAEQQSQSPAARVFPPASPEINRLARLAVQRKEDEDRKLAAMTPAEREAHITKWAADLAPQLAAAGTAYDRECSGNPRGAPPEAAPAALVTELSEEGGE